MAVVHGQDALSDTALQQLFEYVDICRGKAVWNTNLNLWDQSLVQSSSAVLVHPVDPALGNYLLAELYERGKLPCLHQDVQIMFYAWPAGSFIPWHNDYVSKYSMTIYLNRDWDCNNGGAFCWQDWGCGIERHDWSGPPHEARVMTPRFNAYVVMTDAEWHCVTMTTPTAPPRLTLQLFLPHPPNI